MTESALILPDLDLQPGELYLARKPAILRTILGSCVGVTFWSARLGAGALCHGVLPRCPQEASQVDQPLRKTALCGLQHSLPGAAVRRARRSPARTGSESIRGSRRASDSGKPPGPGNRGRPELQGGGGGPRRGGTHRVGIRHWAASAAGEFTSTPAPVKSFSIG